MFITQKKKKKKKIDVVRWLMQNHIYTSLFSETKLDGTSPNWQFKIFCNKIFKIDRNKRGCCILFYKMYMFLKMFLGKQ